MIYLSKLTLNPASRMAQRELANPYQLHRTIMKGFQERREQAGVLHRIDIHPRNGEVTLLVQSREAPDWSALLEVGQGRYLAQPPAPVKQIDVTLPAGKALRFRLRANPTRKTRSKRDPTRKTRVPLKNEEQQRAWLQRKGQQHGFQVRQFQVAQDERATDTIWRNDKEKHTLTLYTVQFEGLLKITDADKFNAAWHSGIGPAKAFGCGLLSLAPA